MQARTGESLLRPAASLRTRGCTFRAPAGRQGDERGKCGTEEAGIPVWSNTLSGCCDFPIRPGWNPEEGVGAPN